MSLTNVSGRCSFHRATKLLRSARNGSCFSVASSHTISASVPTRNGSCNSTTAHNTLASQALLVPFVNTTSLRLITKSIKVSLSWISTCTVEAVKPSALYVDSTRAIVYRYCWRRSSPETGNIARRGGWYSEELKAPGVGVLDKANLDTRISYSIHGVIV